MIATTQTIVAAPAAHSGSSWLPKPGNVKRSTVTPKPTAIGAGGDLAAELPPPRQAAEVVDRADRRRDRSAEQDPAVGPVELEERERRHEDPEQQRDPAQPRDRMRVDAAGLPRLVHDAEVPGEPPDARRQEQDDDEREQEPPDDLRVVAKGVHELRYFVPYRRSPASPRPGTM